MLTSTADRVHALRVSVNLTMEKFGARLGVTKTAISLIESGKNALTDQMFRSIVREFNVSETWLRTGEGEMFRTRSRDEELAAFMGSITLRDDPDDEFKRRLLHVLSRMTTEEWRLLEELARRLVEEVEEKKKDRPE